MNETLFVNLSGAQNAILLDAQGQGTITNDDAAHLTINDVAVAEGNAGTTSMTFTVTLDSEVDTPLSVNYGTKNGIATVGDGDYAATTGTLNFAGTVGETKTISVSVNGDTKVELDETLLVDLSNVVASGRNVTLADSQGLGTIANDDGATLAINDVTVAEGATGTTNLVFTVTLASAVDTSFSVDYGTADGTASVTDGDYAAASGTLLFNGTVGETKTVSVSVNGDQLVELNETLHVVLSNISASGRGVTLVDAEGAGTITNEDSATVTIDNVTVAEGNSGTTNVVFTVTLHAAVDVPVLVDYATQDGTATAADGDYFSASGTLVFTGNANESRTITVLANGDQTSELDESFFVDLSNLLAEGAASHWPSAGDKGRWLTMIPHCCPWRCSPCVITP